MLQGKILGVHYLYYVMTTDTTYKPKYLWDFTEWSECSVRCAGGTMVIFQVDSSMNIYIYNEIIIIVSWSIYDIVMKTISLLQRVWCTFCFHYIWTFSCIDSVIVDRLCSIARQSNQRYHLANFLLWNKRV